ncbi:acyclic terpene utilization AtuA family protein [Fodinibius salsisoli]|uniref:DUF1446 domain-containing protein n=1 Tax=Fodinibius salsisoli TaxID=2820877 RepID=A0ABT3PN56_9BACT|nr:DUF1446 domain-containing protein [Fodinibius salsisoli]
MNNTIRIASGQGFWGDLPTAPIEQVRRGPIDYLVMDYLAEVTMSIMQKQKRRNPDYGYARDFVDVVTEVLPDVARDGIKIISNAGGMNPIACKNKILQAIENQGHKDIKVAVVDGDNIINDIDRLVEEGHLLKNIDTGNPITTVQDKLTSANVYFGCPPIVEALEKGADIIITGRVIDAGLILAPMAHEFGWAFDDFDKMAAGIVAGHAIECGAQVSGGNFTDWQNVDDLVDIGFPIIEASPDGSFVVTKHEGTGGLVNEMTVKEQLVYEIQDPARYLTPDVIADFTSINIEQEGENRVRLSGIKGHPPTDSYKISASYNDGYKLTSSLVYSWPDALEKAQKGGEILKKRAKALGLTFDRFRVEYVGINGCNEQPMAGKMPEEEYDEIQMRVSVAGKDKETLNRFGKEIVPLILTGPSGVTGYAGGRPKASEVVAYWPALLDKGAVSPRLQIFN